jgi:hypothetical protein
MARSIGLVCAFALLVLAGEIAFGFQAPPPPPLPLVKWQWDAGYPKLEKTGAQVGGKDVYKLVAKGVLIFQDNKGVVDQEGSKMWVSVTSQQTPDAWPLEPNRKFKVTVGAQAKLPPTEGQYFYPITAITTINGEPTGEPYVILAGERIKAVPALKYKLSSSDNNWSESQFDPPGYADAK